MHWVWFLYVPSQGELSYDGFQVRVFDFLTGRSSIHTGHSSAPSCFKMHGHGEADYCLMDAFISAVAVSITSVFKFVIIIVGFCRDFVLAHCIQLPYRMWRPWLAWLICFVSFLCSFLFVWVHRTMIHLTFTRVPRTHWWAICCCFKLSVRAWRAEWCTVMKLPGASQLQNILNFKNHIPRL